MKNLKTSLVLIALVIVSGAVMATGNLKVNIVPGESDKAMINVTNAAQSHFEIEVKNNMGDLVFYKQTKTPSTSYNKVYDFSTLDDGQYTFTVKLDKEMETNTLNISNGIVKVVKARKDVEPFFLFENDKFILSYLNFAEDNVKFYLYDNATNDLVLERDLKSDFTVNFGLDFSKLDRGSYEAILTSEDNVYDYNIAIN